MNVNLITVLEELINSKIEDYSIPHVGNNSIRIKHYVVRHSKKAGWLIYDTQKNTQLAKMFCKTSAIALAKTLADSREGKRIQIFELDKLIEKHYNDCIFYKHTMNVTKDDTKYVTAQNRFDISFSVTKKAKEDLDRIILS